MAAELQGASGAAVGTLIRLNAISYPDRVAFVAPGTRPLLYGELQAHIETIRSVLRAAGLGSDARVAVALPSGLEAALTIAAVACSAVAVPIDPRLTGAEIRDRLIRLRIAGVILPRGESSACAAADAQNVAIFKLNVSPGGELDVAILRTSTARRDSQGPAPAYILPTSGTTGHQRFVPFDHSNQVALAAQTKVWLGLGVQDCCLCLSPVFYSLGLSVGIFTPLLTGGSIALPNSTTDANHFRLLDDLNPTWCLGGPGAYRAMSEQAPRSPARATVRPLRFLVSAGMALPESVRTSIEAAVGVPVLEHYGLTECGMIATNRLSVRKPGTCGQVSTQTLAVAGPHGEPVQAGEIGEILVSGPTLTSGYLDDPEANAAAFVDGWLRTGDLGSLDEDGFLTIHGRVKEVINRGGEKIIPSEIDAALVDHPAVAEAAAVSLPHPRSGEQVAAAVVVRKGRTVTASELRDWLGSRLARHKIPRRITFLPSLPRGPTGKVRRRDIASLMTSEAAVTSPAPGGHSSDQAMTETELSQLWSELLESRGPIGLDEDFFEIGGDSILATEMLLELERVIGAPIADDILYQASTIRELAKRLSTFAWSERRLLVSLQDGGCELPFFFCHGDYVGGGHYTRRFARLLGPDQPFLALPPPLLADGSRLPSLEQMAAERVSALLAEQPDGPFRLGGYCNGALLAFETARQLRAAGQQVEFVLMIDPPSFNARPHFRLGSRAIVSLLQTAGLTPEHSQPALAAFSAGLGSFSGRLERFVRATPRDRISKIVRLLARANIRERSTTEVVDDLPACNESSLRVQHPPEKVLHQRWHRVVASYMPSSLDAPTLIFSAAHSGYPWRHYCADIEIFDLPPDHRGCITVDLEFIARVVQSRLSKEFVRKHSSLGRIVPWTSSEQVSKSRPIHPDPHAEFVKEDFYMKQTAGSHRKGS